MSDLPNSPEMPPAPWPRPQYYPTEAAAQLRLLAFSERELPLDTPVSRARHGLPAEISPQVISLEKFARAEDTAWFDEYFSPQMRSLLGPADAAVNFDPTSYHSAYLLTATVIDPKTLAYLQAGWAMTRWLCEQGASLVLDEHALRWWRAEAVLALEPHREFAIRDEISVVVETEGTPYYGHLCHTRGMKKFGRPDLVVFGATLDRAQSMGRLLNGLAEPAARGGPLGAGQKVTAGDLFDGEFGMYSPEDGHPELALNNDALVIDLR